jgi:hypothetical protein
MKCDKCKSEANVGMFEMEISPRYIFSKADTNHFIDCGIPTIWELHLCNDCVLVEFRKKRKDDLSGVIIGSLATIGMSFLYWRDTIWGGQSALNNMDFLPPIISFILWNALGLGSTLLVGVIAFVTIPELISDLLGKGKSMARAKIYSYKILADRLILKGGNEPNCVLPPHGEYTEEIRNLISSGFTIKTMWLAVIPSEHK